MIINTDYDMENLGSRVASAIHHSLTIASPTDQLQGVNYCPFNPTVLLFGRVGTGKSCFARGLVKALCPSVDTVNSPSFLFVQEYRTQHTTNVDESFRVLHADLHRLAIEEVSQDVNFDFSVFDLNLTKINQGNETNEINQMNEMNEMNESKQNNEPIMTFTQNEKKVVLIEWPEILLANPNWQVQEPTLEIHIDYHDEEAMLQRLCQSYEGQNSDSDREDYQDYEEEDVQFARQVKLRTAYPNYFDLFHEKDNEENSI
eukprot:g2521.t1